MFTVVCVPVLVRKVRFWAEGGREKWGRERRGGRRMVYGMDARGLCRKRGSGREGKLYY